jgi:hypothetical protein
VASDYEEGMLIGLLVGEGHFGGDGRQAQVTLRMHVRHEAMFRWIERTFPGGKLYGPYSHDGRNYFQWMARGAFLRDTLLPLLERRMSPEFDAHTYGRFDEMRSRYRASLRRDVPRPPSPSPTSPTTSPVSPSPAGIAEATGGSTTALDEIFGRLRRSQSP